MSNLRAFLNLTRKQQIISIVIGLLLMGGIVLAAALAKHFLPSENAPPVAADITNMHASCLNLSTKWARQSDYLSPEYCDCFTQEVLRRDFSQSAIDAINAVAFLEQDTSSLNLVSDMVLIEQACITTP